MNANEAAIEAVKTRSQGLQDEYTEKLDELVNSLVPTDIDNAEYAARTSALMISLGRELARCAAAFGEVHQIPPGHIVTMVTSQFCRYHQIALQATREAGIGQRMQ